MLVVLLCCESLMLCFVYCDTHHQYLLRMSHSFPTRRSSEIIPELPNLPPARLPPVRGPVLPPVPCGFHRSRYCPPKDRGSIPAPALHDSAPSAQILPPDRPRPTCRRKRTDQPWQRLIDQIGRAHV